MVFCKSLGMLEPFHGSCFGHVQSKVCQYALTKESVCHELIYAFIKGVQINIQNCITWLKKSSKGNQAWHA
jgi:hypothetical protein